VTVGSAHSFLTGSHTPLFRKDADFEARERVLAETCQRYAPRLLAYGLLPKHGHLLVWPGADGLRSQANRCQIIYLHLRDINDLL
jgi:hypothetical protein